MSNNIYDILNKLPKDNPVSVVEAEPIYESIDANSDLTESVIFLEKEYKKFNPVNDDETKYLNPQAKRFVQLAKAKFPETTSDLEAVVASIGDKTEELDQRDRDTAEWISKAKATISQQQREIEQTEQAVVDANARYDAQEKRFQDFNRQVAAANLDVKQQAQAALDFSKQPEAQPQAVIKQVQAQQPAAEPTALPDVTVAQPVVQPQTKSQDQGQSQGTSGASQSKKSGTTKKSNVKDIKTGEPYEELPFDTLDTFVAANDSTATTKKVSGSDIKEAVQMVYPEGSPALGQFNLEKIKKAFNQKLPEITLIFGDNSAEKLTDADIYAIVAWFYLKSKQNADLLPNLAARNLSTQKDVQRLLRTDMVNHYRSRMGSLKRAQAQKQATGTLPLDFNKPKAPETQQQQPATTKPVVQPKKGQLNLFNENNTMKTTKPLEESLMERFEKFREEAKPDFLDLDKDGDTEEPMKKAAKDAKEHEPAKVDKDAVAKRKRLQALKDKQEDERAEKDDYDTKSSSRKIKGRAYGGSAQKDDEDKDELEEGKMKEIYTDMMDLATKKGYSSHKQFTSVDYDELGKKHNISGKELAVALGHKKASEVVESGLQAYLGKKKYGKEGMKALQQAGREGASKEKMAVLRAKHDKFDESAKPDYIDLDKDGDKTEPMKKAAKDAKNVKENDKQGLRRTVKTPEYHTPPVDKAAAEKRKQLQTLKDKQEDQRMANELNKELDEVAPPGAKAERMVKHIKKGYSKDGKLSKKEKAIAYATAWKAHNKGKMQEATEFGDTIKNSEAKMKKHKMVKEGRNPESSEYTYETIGRILCDEQPGLDANSEAFVKAVYDELIEMKLTPKAARWLVHYDEDFIGDCATSYSHFCDSKEKEAMECGAPINSFVSEEPLLDAEHELNEIAKLAGLEPTMEDKCSSCGCADCECNESSCMVDEDAINEAATRKDFRMVADLLKSIPDMAKRTELALYHADIFKEQNPRFKKEMFLAAAGVDTTPIKDAEDEVLVSEEEVGEGNEFSGALAKARAEGKKEFEVDGKKYTVKEDINMNVSANGEEDVVNLIRKLSGMPVVAIQAHPAVAEEVVAEQAPTERDVEYANTPHEDVAGTDAAIPSGADLNRAKRQYRKEYPGDNPMAVAEAKEEQLWKAYETMINDLKA